MKFDEGGVNKKRILLIEPGPVMPLLIAELKVRDFDPICIDAITRPLPGLLLDAQSGTCCASPPKINVAEMIKAFKELAFEVKPQKLVACQVRFPRSKKKRIQKKWARKAKNYSDVDFGFGNNKTAHHIFSERTL